MTQSKKGGRTTLAVIVVAVVLVVALGAYYYLNNMNASSGSQTVTVNIPRAAGSKQALNYSPNTLTLVIGVNNTVNFVNQDTFTHTVTANDGTFNSGDIAAGNTWNHTFSTAGTFSFHCAYHGWMTGTIVVKSA